MIKTKSVYEPIEPDDGIRVLITRYYPRGVKRENFDLWLRDLSPSAVLLKNYKDGKQNWEEFETDFLDEIRVNSKSSNQLEEVMDLSKDKNVTLLCYEKTGHNCHRYLVKDLVNKPVPPIWLSYS